MTFFLPFSNASIFKGLGGGCQTYFMPLWIDTVKATNQGGCRCRGGGGCQRTSLGRVYLAQRRPRVIGEATITSPGFILNHREGASALSKFSWEVSQTRYCPNISLKTRCNYILWIPRGGASVRGCIRVHSYMGSRKFYESRLTTVFLLKQRYTPKVKV